MHHNHEQKAYTKSIDRKHEALRTIFKININSAKDADLNNQEIFDTFTILIWYIHRF